MRQACVKRLEDSRTGSALFWSRLSNSIDAHDTANFNAAGTADNGASHAATKTEMVELTAQRAKTGFDVTQAVPVSQLRECHGEILVPTGEATRSCISAVACHATAELAVGKEADQLRENGSAFVHPSLLPVRSDLGFRGFAIQIAATSNREQLLMLE